MNILKLILSLIGERERERERERDHYNKTVLHNNF